MWSCRPAYSRQAYAVQFDRQRLECPHWGSLFRLPECPHLGRKEPLADGTSPHRLVTTPGGRSTLRSQATGKVKQTRPNLPQSTYRLATMRPYHATSVLDRRTIFASVQRVSRFATALLLGLIVTSIAYADGSETTQQCIGLKAAPSRSRVWRLAALSGWQVIQRELMPCCFASGTSRRQARSA